LKNVRDDIDNNVRYLCELDSVIGDGDHGTTISKGINNAIKQIEINNPSNISDLLSIAGNSIIDTVGGVSGVVFGSLFVAMGGAISTNIGVVGLTELNEMFEKALDVSMTIGKGAAPGEKTMVDALYPAVQSLKKSSTENKSLKEALEEMSVEADKGALSTKDMIATKGRARYLGERSIGFQDPGAASMAIIIKAFSSVFNGNIF
jgi:dihydroxyacetone kinase-like protein